MGKPWGKPWRCGFHGICWWIMWILDGKTLFLMDFDGFDELSDAFWMNFVGVERDLSQKYGHIYGSGF